MKKRETKIEGKPENNFFFTQIDQKHDIKQLRNKDALRIEKINMNYITNDKLEKFRLNFSRCTNREVAILRATLRRYMPVSSY